MSRQHVTKWVRNFNFQRCDAEESLLHDNVRPLVQRKSSFGWDVLNHPSHSPDLASSDYHLFSKLKEYLGGKHFCDDDEVKIDV
ncbi:SETMR methyltransferase, partial [Acromyrmex heyeri]